MTPRRRLAKNRQLPDNLYVHKTKGQCYYQYKHPLTGKNHGMGRDKQQAIAAARILNAKLIKDSDLVSKILNSSTRDHRFATLSELIAGYKKEVMPAKELSPATEKLYLSRLNRFLKDKPDWLISEVSTADIANYLDGTFVNDSYIKHRGMLLELFQFSINKGVSNDNPVQATYSKTRIKKKRNRLKINEYQAIHAIAPEWMKIAMELSLITLQGRYEVCNMKFSDIRDDCMYVVREKTQKNEWAHLRIKMNPALIKLKSRAQQSGIVSPFFVHRNPKRRVRAENKEHWTQLALNDFTKRFRELRDKTGLFDDVPKENRPTFHEIRSLGAWLYEKQGFDGTDYVQKLMAHSDEKMTKYYQSGHEERWMDVRADLDIADVLKYDV
jgi:integrase